MTFLSVVLLDVDWGLFIGLGTSILVVIIRDQMAPLRPLVKPTNRMTLFREDFVRHDSDSDTQVLLNTRYFFKGKSFYLRIILEYSR